MYRSAWSNREDIRDSAQSPPLPGRPSGRGLPRAHTLSEKPSLTPALTLLHSRPRYQGLASAETNSSSSWKRSRLVVSLPDETSAPLPLTSAMTSLPTWQGAAASSSSRQPQRHVRPRSSSSTGEDTSTTATRRDLQDLDPEIRTRLQTIGMRSRKAVADGYLTTKGLASAGGGGGGALERTLSLPTTSLQKERLVLCPQHWEGVRISSGSGGKTLEPFAETGHGLQGERERLATASRKRPPRTALHEALEEDGTIPTDPESEGEGESESRPLPPARVFAQPRRGLLAKTSSMPEAALRRHALGGTAWEHRPAVSSDSTAMDETPEPWQRIQLDGYFDADSGF